MEPIIDIISSGKFRLGNQSIEPKEVFVRNMTVFEKALWTMDINLTDAYNKAAIELQELHKGGAFITAFSLLTLSSEGISGPSTHYLPRDENHADVIKANSLEKQIELQKIEVKIVDDLLWEVIMAGIDPETLEAYTSQGIRKRFKIVVYNKEED